MIDKRQIGAWQKEFAAQPQVFCVLSPDDNIVNFYESYEAAEHEIEFRERSNHKGFYIQAFLVHSLKLSRERWSE